MQRRRNRRPLKTAAERSGNESLRREAYPRESFESPSCQPSVESTTAVEVKSPPLMDQMTPVPAQAIHLRNPRRSMPSSFVFVSMKSDIMACTLVDRIGRAIAHPSSGTYQLRSEIIPGRTGKQSQGINFNEGRYVLLWGSVGHE